MKDLTEIVARAIDRELEVPVYNADFMHQTGQWERAKQMAEAVLAALRDAGALVESGPIAEIAKERQRQISVEGYDRNHDDAYIGGELARAAACYATPWRFRAYAPWPWGDQYKPAPVGDWPRGRRRELVKAGALIVAEIERIDRASPLPKPPEGK